MSLDQAEVSARPDSKQPSHIIVTRQMICQCLGTFGNGTAKAARVRFRRLRGAMPEWGDRHARHPDRQLFNVAIVARSIFPDDPSLQQRLIDCAWEHYAHKVDREAIKHAPARLRSVASG